MTGRSEFKISGVVPDDPNEDYEYYDTHDFGDEMDEAERNGELFRGRDFPGCNFIEAIDKASAILAAKRAKEQADAQPQPYPYPHQLTPAEELCVAETPKTEYR